MSGPTGPMYLEWGLIRSGGKRFITGSGRHRAGREQRFHAGRVTQAMTVHGTGIVATQ